MAIVRRRLLFWLFKAYIKKWGKVITVSFFVGLLVFFLLVFSSRYIGKFLTFDQKTSVGIPGGYTLDALPLTVSDKLSTGLTKIEDNGQIKPSLATSWEIEDEGRKYTFHLKKNLKFSDNTEITSKTIDYRFTDVKTTRPDTHTIVYELKSSYAPFLITVSRPLFKPGYIGVGEYRIKNIDVNGDFIKTLTLVSTKNNRVSIDYKFYPTIEAVKTAFALGEVQKIENVLTPTFKGKPFSVLGNTTVTKRTNYDQLVTLFYNTQDPTLSDKKIRDGLSYSLPDVFEEGERSFLPYSPEFFYFNSLLEPRTNDKAHAEILFDSALSNASGSALPKLTITTLSKYEATAKKIKESWEKVGIESEIKKVDTRPVMFQVYLGDFNVPRDPDQYTLWHANQVNNITKFNNQRIDLLLEQGRRNVNVKERKEIYDDFQKYLLDEQPASFLYFPYFYEIKRN